MEVILYVEWGEKILILNGNDDFSNGSKNEFIIFCK
jgi:hypothetical protein